MKKILLIIISCISFNISAQSDIKTITRPDGNTIKYFNPKPIIIQKQYEVGTAIYKNVTSGKYMINISVLFKTIPAKDIKGKLTIQTQGKKGLVLKLVKSEQVEMNGRKLATALYEIDKVSLVELKKYPLKSIFFYLGDKQTGATATKNKSLIITEIKSLE
ncbi:hypothetical protein [Flavobacterium sp. 25HG05S-40]|uniref:hypothetical protein n=1 Tax=Flavobacterium sp. 25HG05S-40 TaxID=3458682 RepID=UPI0040441323